MRMMLSGLSGWAKMGKTKSDSLRTVDAAITVTGTLLAAATWAIIASYRA